FDVPDDLESQPDNLNIEDEWILHEFNSVLLEVGAAWTNLDIYTATQALKSFGTGILPSHYLEMVKSRLYDGDLNAAWTIHRIVRDFMSAFSPICPFFTHHISSTIYGQSAVDVDSFPGNPFGKQYDENRNDYLRSITNELQSFNGEVWSTKKENGISLNQPISGVAIPENLKEFTEILTSMHSLE
ncbi:MAG: class I tRNA ligase family protein, partial [Candidatus Thermoplasmatota archaeon]|nr:class I tRNA ligase family protein [Candidatus Thermoplasmatota archaeon]